MNDIARYSEETFEKIMHVNEYGQEYWQARELQIVLKYTEWRNFAKVIAKAVEACKGSGIQPEIHFVEVNKMVEAGVASKVISDYALSRYACYLIVQNGSVSK